MSQFLHSDAARGQGCIRNQWNEERAGRFRRCEEKFEIVRNQLDSIIGFALEDIQENLIRQVSEDEAEMILSVWTQAEKRIEKLIEDSDCFSVQGLKVNNSAQCRPFHLLWHFGKLTGNPARNIPTKMMAELTRHWAVCEPVETIVVSTSSAITTLTDSTWNAWIETYKSWGGGITIIGIDVRPNGWLVKRGPRARL